MITGIEFIIGVISVCLMVSGLVKIWRGELSMNLLWVRRKERPRAFWLSVASDFVAAAVLAAIVLIRLVR